MHSGAKAICTQKFKKTSVKICTYSPVQKYLGKLDFIVLNGFFQEGVAESKSVVTPLSF